MGAVEDTATEVLAFFLGFVGSGMGWLWADKSDLIAFLTGDLAFFDAVSDLATFAALVGVSLGSSGSDPGFWST